MSRKASGFVRGIVDGWHRLSLVIQFVSAATAVMAVGMLILGAWVTRQIEAGVVRNTAISTAFYLDSYIEPLVQGLGQGNILPEPAAAAIRTVLTETHLGEKIVAVNLRTRAGDSVFKSSKAEVRDTETLTEAVKRAATGAVYSELGVAVSRNGRSSRSEFPVLAIISPVHRLATNEVIAVAEIHLDAAELRRDVQSARLHTTLIVGAITLLMLALLYSIVRRGSMTIDEQRAALEGRVDELSRLLGQNENLRLDLVDARARVVSTNERVLRRIGADLHDGPAQLIGLALLRFNDLDPENSGIPVRERRKGYELLQTVLRDSLDEIRAICSGIAPPELDNVSIAKALELAASFHEKRTGTQVTRRFDDRCSAQAPPLLKTCLYRFAQEGLNNAYRHAGGTQQQLEAWFEGQKIIVRVGDEGRGFTPDLKLLTGGGLGLAGLRDRIESLGGSFLVESAAGRGTWLTATFDLNRNG